MQIEVFQEPFPYIHFSNVLSINTSTKILSELENQTNWIRVKRHLYELDVLEQISSAPISYHEPDILEFLDKVHKCISDQFGIVLDRKVQLHIHRFSLGTAISLHTDSAEQGARLVIFLKSILKSTEGGYLLLVNSLSGTTKLIAPTNNTAVLFFTHSDWFHAVTEQTEGTRYSMVFQLFRK